jgi:cadmium resistance protein CadD (predicted permease)
LRSPSPAAERWGSIGSSVGVGIAAFAATNIDDGFILSAFWLFATAPSAVPVYVSVFAAVTAIWCLLGYLLVNNPLVGAGVRRHGHLALPLVLIALGAYILSGAAGLFRRERGEPPSSRGCGFRRRSAC